MGKDSMSLIAVDPGPVQSAFVIWDGEKVLKKGIRDNDDLADGFVLWRPQPKCAVFEKVACYGMPVGESIFETVWWTGYFSRVCAVERIKNYRMLRKDVKMHLCHTMRAKDSNIIQALVDRFAPMERNKGKGTKKEPGFFYGFKKDIWQAFALAVTWWDLNAGEMK